MPASGVEPGPPRQTHEVITPLARCALVPLTQTPLLKEALIPQVQPSGWHFLLLTWTLGISLSPISKQRPVQLSREYLPAHQQLECGLATALTASTPSPHLCQFIRQADATAIFDDHGRETLEQRQWSDLCLQTNLGQPP